VSRRKGRILAFQALYSYDVGKKSLDDLLKLDWVDNNTESEAKNADTEKDDFARILISGTINHLEEIDALIKGHLSERWEFDRVNKVSLAILRVSIFQLLYQKETPGSVVIDEAIAIAKEFDTDISFKFINAVLDKIRKEIAT
jgi:N utilization substance protein B